MFASGLVANLSVTALEETVLYEPIMFEASATSFSLALNGCTQNAEFTEDEEDKTVIFSATCRQFEGEEIESVDAQTEEVVAVMLDDGNFTDSGDDLENNGT
ncbi:MAG: hypothetical protein LUC50_06425 [Ruminococcus sp.]|nr:hypothetical protein [Ruminococcus sp.]